MLLGIYFVAGIVCAQTESPRDILIKGITEKFQDVKEMSAVVEMNMSMMGVNMKMPVKMWMKGNLIRMDSSMSIPGTDKNMEQITVSDGKTISIYNSLNNTVMVIDLNKLPEDMRKMVMNQTGQHMGFDPEVFNKIKDLLKVEEKTRNNRKIYFITADNVDAIRASLKMPPAASQIPFKKLIYMIDYETLFPIRVEVYTESETPGMWMDFIEMKISGVPDAVFNVKFPENANKIDITDSVKSSLSK